MVTEKFRISDMERVNFQGKPAVAGDLRFPIIRSCQFTMMLLDECYHLVATVVDEYLSDYQTRESVNYLCASGPAGHFSPHFFCPLDDDKLCGDATWVAVTYLPYTADCCFRDTSIAFNLSRMPVELRQHSDGHLYYPPYSQFADGRTLYYRLKLPDKCWRDEDGDVILIDECGDSENLPTDLYVYDDRGDERILYVPVDAISPACSHIRVACYTDTPYTPGSEAARAWRLDHDPYAYRLEYHPTATSAQCDGPSAMQVDKL